MRRKRKEIIESKKKKGTQIEHTKRLRRRKEKIDPPILMSTKAKNI